jgi:hypothetical protein
VSYGIITDTVSVLQLPALAGSIGNGHSIERKACYDSTEDASATGMAARGGQELIGNGEKLGASNADWTFRATPDPQNSGSVSEPYGCP